MARNVNVWLSSENDGTKRQNVTDYLVHLRATWVDGAGAAHDQSVDRYLLAQLNWLRTNYPGHARELMHKLVYEIERVRQGIDDAGALS
jgi:hypothetical protein